MDVKYEIYSKILSSMQRKLDENPEPEENEVESTEKTISRIESKRMFLLAFTGCIEAAIKETTAPLVFSKRHHDEKDFIIMAFDNEDCQYECDWEFLQSRFKSDDLTRLITRKRDETVIEKVEDPVPVVSDADLKAEEIRRKEEELQKREEELRKREYEEMQRTERERMRREEEEMERQRLLQESESEPESEPESESVLKPEPEMETNESVTEPEPVESMNEAAEMLKSLKDEKLEESVESEPVQESVPEEIVKPEIDLSIINRVETIAVDDSSNIDYHSVADNVQKQLLKEEEEREKEKRKNREDVEDNIVEEIPVSKGKGIVFYQNKEFGDDKARSKRRDSFVCDSYLITGTSGDKVIANVFPLRYLKNEPVATDIFVTFANNSGQYRGFISGSEKKIVKNGIGDWGFSVTGKWSNGEFTSTLHRLQGTDEINIQLKEIRPKNPTNTTHQIVQLDDKLVHIFPTAFVNDRSTGTCNSIAWAEDEDTIFIPTPTHELPYTKFNSKCLTTYWEGKDEDIELKVQYTDED